MNKDNHLIFERYFSKFFKSEPFNSEDCEDQAGVVDWRLRNKQSTDHVEHGRSAAKWELHSGEKVENPHHPDSDEGREWQFGYNEEKGIKKEEAAEDDFREQRPDSRENAEHAYGVDPDEAKDYDMTKFEIKRAADKIVHCLTGYEDSAFDKKPVTVTATPEKAAFTIGSEDKMYKVTVELARSSEDEEVNEAKHSKKHVFTKVEKAAEKAGYSKKSAEKIAGAAKAKAAKKK